VTGFLPHEVFFNERSKMMLYRSPPLFLVALALFVSQPAFADDKPHEGKVVKVGDGKLTMTFKGDEKKHTHDVGKDAKSRWTTSQPSWQTWRRAST
jgi:hypothetical protein